MGLLQYFASRIGSYLVVLFIGLTITFFLPRLLPSDPIENYIVQLEQQAGQTMSPEDLQAIRETLQQIYGLEGSLSSQYVGYLESVVLHFDFGPSLANFPTPVNEIILKALVRGADRVVVSGCHEGNCRSMDGTAIAMTFEPHPIRVITNNGHPPLITLFDQKVELIEKSGIDVLIVSPARRPR